MPRMTYSGTTGAIVTYGITKADKTVDTAPTATGVTADLVGTDRTAYSVVVADNKRGMTIDWYEGGQYIASEEIPDDVLTPLAVVDANVDGILVDTGTDIPASIAALPTAVWAATARTLTSEDIDGDTLITHATLVDGDGNIDATGTALGRILDSSGNPVPGATLTLYAASDTTRANPLRRTTAAADGTWTLPAPSGSLVLEVRKDGYYDATEGDATITVAITVE